MTTPKPDCRAVVADIAIDIELAAMRAHEAVNGDRPYSMNSPQFKIAGMALDIAARSREIRDFVASTYPPPPEPTKGDER